MAAKRAGLGMEAVVGCLAAKDCREYKVSNRLQEGRRPLYAICFNLIDSRFHSVFASAGGYRVTVYQCMSEGGAVAVLQAYVDEDKEEEFFTVSWAVGDKGAPLLAVSGRNGVIRIIDCGADKLLKSFVGHGDSVNELRTQALNPCLVASASKDESVRLWNVNRGVCILIFAGAGGHRNEVLSVDFHPSDILQICSCGMDNTIKIWSLKGKVFNALVHSNYVDCARWLGDFILSKSVDNEIVLWEPQYQTGTTTNDGKVDILQKYPVPDCDIWFIKFSCDFHFNTLTIGNREGRVLVWEAQSSPPKLLAKLSHSQCKSPIRQTATSFDGRMAASGGGMQYLDLSGSVTKLHPELFAMVVAGAGQQ